MLLFAAGACPARWNERDCLRVEREGAKSTRPCHLFRAICSAGAAAGERGSLAVVRPGLWWFLRRSDGCRRLAELLEQWNTPPARLAILDSPAVRIGNVATGGGRGVHSRCCGQPALSRSNGRFLLA
jgi:hypothetical protein